MRRILKKTFKCGHKGLGKYCRRCQLIEQERLAAQLAEAEKLRRAEEAKLQRRNYLAMLEELGVKVGEIPFTVAQKAGRIVADIHSGVPYFRYKWKRLKAMGQRSVIRIRVNRKYRLIFFETENGLRFQELLPHHEYDLRLSTGGWQV